MSAAVAVLLCLIGQDAAPTETPAEPPPTAEESPGGDSDWQLTPEQERAIEEDEARNRPLTPEDENRLWYENHGGPRPRTPSQNLPQFNSQAQSRSNRESERIEAEESPTPKPPRPPIQRALDISGGVGVSAPTVSNSNGSASGGTAEVAYVWIIQRWLTPRVYAGGLVTGRGDCKSVRPCDVGSQIGYLGGLVHLMAPIPYFGPFVELGVGASAGSIHTIEGSVANERHSGVMPHARLGFGVAFGRQNNVEIGLRFMDHFTANSVGGGFTIGARLLL